jgi:hypothetical protein
MKIAAFWDVLPYNRMFTDVSVEHAASVIRIYPEDYAIENKSLRKRYESFESWLPCNNFHSSTL